MSRLPRREKGRRAAVITNSSPSHNAHFSIVQSSALRELGFAFCAVGVYLKSVQVVLSAHDKVYAASKAIDYGLLIL
jgi:hypothetical protein